MQKASIFVTELTDLFGVELEELLSIMIALLSFLCLFFFPGRSLLRNFCCVCVEREGEIETGREREKERERERERERELLLSVGMKL